MTDARFENSRPQNQHQAEPYKSRPLFTADNIRGAFAGLSTLKQRGVIIAGCVLAYVVVGEVVFPSDARLRPANLIGGFVSDVDDHMRGTATKWAVKEHGAMQAIDRETEAVREEIMARSRAIDSKIKAVDQHQIPGILSGFVKEFGCALGEGASGGAACVASAQHRRNMIDERQDLIGEVKILYTDEEVLARIGLPEDFLK